MNEKQLKRIILEEIQRVLSEEVLPPAPRNPPTAVSMQSQQRPPAPNTISDTGQMTRQEKAESQVINLMKAWGKQLTTVKYRQFLQDCLGFVKNNSNSPFYRKILLVTQNAIDNKSNYKDALFLYDLATGDEPAVGKDMRFSQALIESGYPDVNDHY